METDADRLEVGRLLFAQSCDFRYASDSLERLPPQGLPEVAFAGRSNVGKSSLVNALTARRTLARTSQTPGRTQQLIFFDLGSRLALVDMPGYGYAKVSKTLSASWRTLLRDYLRGRVTLKRAYVLLDSRHGIKPVDKEILALLDNAAVPYRVVLTKADKAKAVELEATLAALREQLRRHPAALPEPLVTSSETGAGIPELRADIAALADDR